jgi:hypothetical protein
MEVAVLAANVLDERSAAQEAEGPPFMQKGGRSSGGLSS